MNELLEQFLIEGRDLVADAQAQLVRLLDNPGDMRAIDGAFRAVHTLKGSVAIFAMTPAERVLHAGEEVLARVRKAGSALEAAELTRLVATLDQVDRWIDEMEADGALAPSAASVADALIGVESAPAPADKAEPTNAATPNWVLMLSEREDAAIALAEAALTAFRYTPDPDAFFRGDDPLAIVAGVPDLIALSIFPAAGEWPASDAFDPFACLMVIEGLSAAPRADLQPVFRLVPDQITFHTIDRATDVSADQSPRAATILRVDAARIEALADGVGELVVAANAFTTVAALADGIDTGVAQAIRAAQADLQRAVGTVCRSVSVVRLVPLAPTLRRLPRLVREIAADLGKPIDFALSGEQTEVDKQIADGLFEPLLHLIRNALDHGIEAPGVRASASKPAAGTLSLAITRDGEDVVVILGDDGAGIDPARIRDVAVARGLIDASSADALSDATALGLIFRPGFSTAATVSGVSGRGVGMDAVQAAVERMRGRIEIDSRIGEGTRFILRLPANALTTRLLVVEVGADRYAVPIDQIEETARVGGDRLMPVGTGMACVLRDRTLPVLSLAHLLGAADRASLPARLLVTRAGGERVALRVDAFAERIDAVVRRPSGLLSGMASVAGTALLGDGGVLLVLNLQELVA